MLEDVWEVEMVCKNYSGENETFHVTGQTMSQAVEKGIVLMKTKEDKSGESFGDIRCVSAKYLCTLDA